MNHAAHLLAEMNATNAIRKAETHEQALVLLATLLEADTLDEQEQEVASDAIRCPVLPEQTVLSGALRVPASGFNRNARGCLHRGSPLLHLSVE
ncbi:hypothetical protein [Deinococcus cellulosilyticus]|uniref:hypothetical protein n=1 Tax=Deinococcus cellulosilyticus TaxID=401558 RepID=UPI0011BE5963|nr:hypothetical protein [Deinococcus cellulosilyticus]